MYLINPYQSADQSMAQLTRAQYTDYLNRTLPVEQQLMSQSENPATISNAVSRADNIANTSSNVTAANEQRQATNYGLSTAGDAGRAMHKHDAFARAEAKIAARDMARGGAVAQRNQTQEFMVGVNRGHSGEAQSQQSTLSGLAVQRANTNARLRAQSNAQDMNAVAGLAGLATMALL